MGRKTDIKDGLIAAVGKKRLLQDEPMAKHISFRVGGPADFMVHVRTVEELKAVLEVCRKKKEPWFVLGRGTNLLVGDKGYRGVVITMTGEGARPETDTSRELPDLKEEESREQDFLNEVVVNGLSITAGAGASLARVAVTARDHGLSGLEFAAGIPGAVGGGLTMNAGAYDGEMKMVVSSADLLMPDATIMHCGKDDLRFGYRKSVFKEIPAIALKATFTLEKKDPAEIQAKMVELAGKRKEKQPLEYPSAGSTFRRPEGHFAGALIEEAGLKGMRIGGACVSEKHCGFVVNDQHGTAADIKAVIEAVQQKVLETSGILLEREVIFLGDF